MTARRILFFVDSLGAGGAERQLLYLLSSLDRDKYQPYILTLYGDEYARPHFEPAVEKMQIPHSSLDIGWGKRERLRGGIEYARVMWRQRPILVQAWLHDANLTARLARYVCPRHVLLTSERLVLTPRGLLSERLTGWLDNCLTVNSPHIARQIQAAHIVRPSTRLAVIPNGVPVERYAQNTDPTLRDRLFPNSSFVIGLIGRIVKQKDHVTLLQALLLSRTDWPKKLAVFFLGDAIEPERLQIVQDMIQQLDLQDIVHIIPATQDVTPYYHAADVITLPSLAEGFPNVILEAFSAGKTVIASTDADAVGIVQPGQTGWHFQTGDAEALANCLRERWSMPSSEVKKMEQQAQRQVEAYTVEAYAQAYMHIYDSLLTQSNHSA